MTEEPSPRAQWNVKIIINFFLLIAAGALIAYGLIDSQLTVQDALSYVAATALGRGISWLEK